MPETATSDKRHAALRGLWSLLWHMVVLTPFALALFALYCYAWMGLLALPFAAGYLMWSSQWGYAWLCAALWVASFAGVRWIWRRERSDESRHDGRV